MTVGDVCKSLDQTLLQCRIIEAGRTNRLREPDPLCAIIVPMLEQMLDRGHSQPSTQPGRRQPDQCECAGCYNEPHLRHTGEIARKNIERSCKRDHHDQIGSDHHEREKPEGDCP